MGGWWVHPIKQFQKSDYRASSLYATVGTHIQNHSSQKKQNTGLPTSLSILSRNITPGIIRLPGSPSICLRNYPATVSVMTTQMWQKFHQVINSLINAKVDTPAGHSWRRCSRFLCSFFAPLIIALISCVFIIGSSAPFLIREITLKNCT